MELISIKNRTIIGEATANIPKSWVMDDYSYWPFDSEVLIKVYQADDGSAVPTLRLQYHWDYEEVATYSFAVVVPFDCITSIKLGRPVWQTSVSDEERGTIHEKFYYKNELDDYLKEHPNADVYQSVEYDEWSPMAWDLRPGTDPAFCETFTSGERFSSPEEAEAYGIKHFGEDYAGIEQVGYAKDPKEGVNQRISENLGWKWCGELHSHCEKENDCYNCPYGLHS